MTRGEKKILSVAKVESLSDFRGEPLSFKQEARLLKRDIDNLSIEVEKCKPEIKNLSEPIVIKGTKSHLSSLGLDSEMALVTMMVCRKCGKEWYHSYQRSRNLTDPRPPEPEYWWCPNGCNR